MEEKIRLAVFGQKRLSREGGMCLSLRTPISITAVAARASALWQIFTS